MLSFMVTLSLYAQINDATITGHIIDKNSPKIDTVKLYKTLKEHIIGQDEGLKTIVGTIWNNGTVAKVYNCYNQSNVSADTYAGGIIGTTFDTKTVENIYHS